MKVVSGVTRHVLLFGNCAIKVPNVRNGWAHFLHGLLSNMSERRFRPLCEHFHLAPVLCGVPGGWLNMQRRCEPLTDSEWSDVELSGGKDAEFGRSDWYGMICDLKRANFGTLNGRVVLLDYGEFT